MRCLECCAIFVVVSATIACSKPRDPVLEDSRARTAATIDIADTNDTSSPTPGSSSTASPQAVLSLAESRDGVRDVYPILKAYDWSHKDVAAFKNFHDLDKPPVPLIAFCHDDEGSYKILSRAALEAESDSVDELMAEAQRNIDAYEVEWEEFNDFMITASGKDFSAEKMLCKAFLIEAQQKLDAKQLLIAAPRRTVLYAANAEMSDEQLEEFLMLLTYTLQDDSYNNELISPLAFRYEDGEVVGAMVIREKTE